MERNNKSLNIPGSYAEPLFELALERDLGAALVWLYC